MFDDDNELMHQLKRGRKKAFNRLVEKYKKPAYFLALGMVGNSDDAYDVSQEAFLRVYKAAGSFDERQRFFPWFYSIIANLCRNVIRRRRVRDSRNVDITEVEHVLATEETPESDLMKRDNQRRLLIAIQKLNFADREIINLCHFRMMSYEEMATLLNIPKGTVMSRLYNARKRLARLMEED